VFDVRAIDNNLVEFALFSFVKLARAAGLGSITKTIQTFSIITQNRIAKCLPFHAREARRLSAVHAFQRIGDRLHAHSRAPVVLTLRHPPQVWR